MNSRTIADIGKGNDNISLVFLLWNFVLQYIAIKYDAVHKPAGRQFTTKNGNLIPMNEERIESTSFDKPILSNISNINRF